jgi:hypothetical protein
VDGESAGGNELTKMNEISDNCGYFIMCLFLIIFGIGKAKDSGLCEN